MRPATKTWTMAAIGLLACGSFLYYLLSSFEQRLVAAKAIVDVRAVVTRKQHIRFSEENPSYLGQQGDVIERRAGDEEYRLYFRIMDDGRIFDAPTRAEIAEAERLRQARQGDRFTGVKREVFEAVDEGDEVWVAVQHPGGGRLLVWGAHTEKQFQS